MSEGDLIQIGLIGLDDDQELRLQINLKICPANLMTKINVEK